MKIVIFLIEMGICVVVRQKKAFGNIFLADLFDLMPVKILLQRLSMKRLIFADVLNSVELSKEISKSLNTFSIWARFYL